MHRGLVPGPLPSPWLHAVLWTNHTNIISVTRSQIWKHTLYDSTYIKFTTRQNSPVVSEVRNVAVPEAGMPGRGKKGFLVTISWSRWWDYEFVQFLKTSSTCIFMIGIFFLCICQQLYNKEVTEMIVTAAKHNAVHIWKLPRINLPSSHHTHTHICAYHSYTGRWNFQKLNKLTHAQNFNFVW